MSELQGPLRRDRRAGRQVDPVPGLPETGHRTGRSRETVRAGETGRAGKIDRAGETSRAAQSCTPQVYPHGRRRTGGDHHGGGTGAASVEALGRSSSGVTGRSGTAARTRRPREGWRSRRRPQRTARPSSRPSAKKGARRSRRRASRSTRRRLKRTPSSTVRNALHAPRARRFPIAPLRLDAPIAPPVNLARRTNPPVAYTFARHFALQVK